LSHRPTLRSTGEEDARCVEPTSATHTNYVHPHLVRSRLAPLVAQRGRPPETKAPDDTIGGPSVSRHPRPLRRTVPACLLRGHFRELRTWAFSSHGAHAAEPLTPLSRSTVSSSALHRASPMLPASSSWPLARVFTGWSGSEDVAERQARRVRRLREEPTPVSSWDAFYRQGPFVGSGGLYSPGPATRSPLLAMVEPLSGTLAPPWVFVRTSPF